MTDSAMSRTTPSPWSIRGRCSSSSSSHATTRLPCIAISGRRGLLGVQHVAFWTTRFDHDLARMKERGFTVKMSGRVGKDGRFVYFAEEHHPGTCIELSEVLGPKGRMFDMIREAAENWDGSDPVRPFPDLDTI